MGFGQGKIVPVLKATQGRRNFSPPKNEPENMGATYGQEHYGSVLASLIYQQSHPWHVSPKPMLPGSPVMPPEVGATPGSCCT